MIPSRGKGAYHLEQMVDVEAKNQLMMFTHRLGHPDWPIQSITFAAPAQTPCSCSRP